MGGTMFAHLANHILRVVVLSTKGNWKLLDRQVDLDGFRDKCSSLSLCIANTE